MPANDNFASATVITGATGAQTGSNAGATVEGGEPGHYNYSPFPNYPVARAIIGPFATVWYSWTCPANGDYFFSTRDLTGAGRTNFRSTIEAYTGSAVNALTRVTYLLDQASGEGFGNNNFASIAFTATSGTTYYIQVDGLDAGDTGNIYLTWGNYVSVRFGACNSCGPDFINEICLGTLSIVDVTTDSINSFGMFALDPGNWKIRYCGGYFYQNSASGPPISAGYLSWCGQVFNSASAPTMWNPTTSFPSGSIVLFSDLNFGDAGIGPGLYGMFASTGVNSVFNPNTSAFFTMICGSCMGGINTHGTTNPGIWNWTIGNWQTLTGQCCPAILGSDYLFVACTGGPTTNASSYGIYCPSNHGSWSATDGSGYTGGNWGTVFSNLGSSTTLYSTGALAEAALQCTDTGWFKNIAGEIGIGFNSLRHWTALNTSSCPTQYSLYQNSAKNPTVQLIHQPFTSAMLQADPEGVSIGNIAGNNWNFQFFIKNLSNVNWDNVTVTLLASGGVTAPGTPSVVTLASLATTGANITGTCDPTAGLQTATIQISRNGVLVTTLAYPLYPVVTLSLSGGVTSNTCTVPAYQQNVLMSLNANQVSNLRFFFTGTTTCGFTNQACIIGTFQLDGGAVTLITDLFSCTTGSTYIDDTYFPYGGNVAFSVQAPQSGVSAGAHSLSAAITWCNSTSAPIALTSTTYSVVYP